MSASALVFERSGDPLGPEPVVALLRAVPGGGAAPTSGLSKDWLHTAHRGLSDGDETSLAVDTSGRFGIYVDGRVDRIEGRAAAEPNDSAGALLDRFASFGASGLRGVDGSFSGAAVDFGRRSVTLFRDPLGNRGLAYYLDDGRLVAATDEAVVLAHGSVPRSVDRVRVAEYFSFGELTSSRSFFQGVRSVLPGHALDVTAETVQQVPFWSLPAEERLQVADPREYAEEFRRLLKNAVSRRMAGARRPAVLLSGGLDSSPIAASARAEFDGELRSVSWIFPNDPPCDERSYSNAVAERLGLRTVHVNCEREWPLRDPETWPAHPTTPEQDAYRGFQLQSLAAARDEGVDLLLTGMFGDHLFTDTSGWLWDAWQTRRALGSMGRSLKQLRGMREAARAIRGGWRSATGAHLAAGSSNRSTDWLTQEASDLLPQDSPWPLSLMADGAAPRGRPLQLLRAFELLHGHGMAVERLYSRGHGLRLGYPFRDLPLIEFLLKVPTTQLFDGRVKRPIVRRAFGDLLPKEVTERSGKTSFEPILRKAFEGETGRFIVSLLTENTDWSRWVREDAFLPSLRKGHSASLSDREIMLTWACVCWTLWTHGRKIYETV